MRAAAAEQLGMRAIVPLTLGRSFPPHTASDPASYAQYLARYLACDPRGFALMSAALARNTSAQTLSRIRCRTLVLAGRDDTVRPSSETISVAGEIPGAQHAVIDGGHFMHVAQPDALTAAIGAFLRV